MKNNIAVELVPLELIARIAHEPQFILPAALVRNKPHLFATAHRCFNLLIRRHFQRSSDSVNRSATHGGQFQMRQGDAAINAQATANGTTNSGNQDIAPANYNQGLAGQTYNNYVGALQPYLGNSDSSAKGIGGLYGVLGNALNANQNNLANLNMNASTGIGAAQPSADLADQSHSG